MWQKKYHSKVHRAAVGEINVVNKMMAVNAIIGGEGSGGVILPECHNGRDSLVWYSTCFKFTCRNRKNRFPK